jgi:hypothetical protein
MGLDSNLQKNERGNTQKGRRIQIRASSGWQNKEKGTTTMKRAGLITLATLAALTFCGPLGAAARTAGNQWTFSVTPHLWLPNVDGTLKYSVPPGVGGIPEVRVGPNDYLEALNMVMMISGEARKDRDSKAMNILDFGFHRRDDFLRDHQIYEIKNLCSSDLLLSRILS